MYSVKTQMFYSQGEISFEENYDNWGFRTNWFGANR